jgi:hypothetical protein
MGSIADEDKRDMHQLDALLFHFFSRARRVGLDSLRNVVIALLVSFFLFDGAVSAAVMHGSSLHRAG